MSRRRPRRTRRARPGQRAFRRSSIYPPQNPDIRDCGSPLGVSGKPAAFPRERTSSCPLRDPYRHPRRLRELSNYARGLWLTRACSTHKTATNWTRTGAAGIVRRLKRPCRRNRPNDHRRQSQSRRARAEVPNDLAAFWMPFTPNRAFKKRRASSRARRTCITSPRRAARFWDGSAALWCCNAGHNRAPIVAGSSARRQSSISPRPSSSPILWRSSSPRDSPISRRPTSITSSSATPDRKPPTPRSRSPSPITTCAVTGSRQRLIGRERGYHGVGFGGISVGGMVNNRKFFGSLIAGVDHRRRHTIASTRPSPRASRRSGRASRRRARGHRRPARRLHHCGRHRRTDGRLDRRPAPARRLSQSPA